MRILSVGGMHGVSNTCVHRNWALESCADSIDVVNTYHPYTLWCRIAHHMFLYGLPKRLPDLARANEKIRQLVDHNRYDVVWIDKGLTIAPETLAYIKKRQSECKIVSYSPDNMALRHNQSQQYLECLPLYDYNFTTKSYIIDDLRKLGGGNIVFVNKSYEMKFHHPYSLTDEERIRLGADVGFIGAYENARWESIRFLVNNGIKVTVWGAGKGWAKWIDYSPNLTIHLGGLFSEDYAKSFQAIKISLCFLRKMNFDQQTSRTMEIPACGGFMLAERTDEHKALFEEDKEAVFFSSDEELLEKCRYYLTHDEERQDIALAGYHRCIESDYSNLGMIKRALALVLNT